MPSTLNEFLEKALVNELKMPKQRTVSGGKNKAFVLDKKIFNVIWSAKIESIAEFLDDNFGKKIDAVIKELKLITGKPKFGKASAIGQMINALETLRSKQLDFTEAWDKATDIKTRTDWTKEIDN